uniref:Disease resistance protein At4g27190-like leucine-rich repeats domain-containing protein n=1 Tax=Vitis vinifera TaxID=29760 RepID=A5AV38_VITVI|nr:hypothetical protein VITISV_013426 [Vitis vinifera]
MESICKLRVLNVLRYGDNLVAIPSFMLHTLHNLEKLNVRRCGSVKEVVHLEELVDEESHAMALDKLREVQLHDLPELTHLSSLTSFCSGGCTFTFPSLDHLVVEECPKMKVFSQGFSTTPRLERVDVANNEWHWEDDLNTTIQKLFIQLHGVVHGFLSLNKLSIKLPRLKMKVLSGKKYLKQLRNG